MGILARFAPPAPIVPLAERYHGASADEAVAAPESLQQLEAVQVGSLESTRQNSVEVAHPAAVDPHLCRTKLRHVCANGESSKMDPHKWGCLALPRFLDDAASRGIARRLAAPHG